jgi:hypothetical protein
MIQQWHVRVGISVTISSVHALLIARVSVKSIVMFILRCSNIPDTQQINTVNYCTCVVPRTVKVAFITCVHNIYACLNICVLYPGITATLVIPGHAVAQWLRHCATSQKVAGSIFDGVIRIFHWHNPSSRTKALGLTQSRTGMSTRNISWGVKAAGTWDW